METSELITVNEAARRLEVNPRTVARAVDRGELKAKWGGLHKNRIVGIYAESVTELQSRATPPQSGYMTREICPEAR